jgi:hypothetical protein
MAIGSFSGIGGISNFLRKWALNALAAACSRKQKRAVQRPAELICA